MIQHSESKSQRGFTLVELMIAMTFITFLLFAIAAAVMQIGSIYNKGITMKSVNQAGRAVVADMKQTIGQSSTIKYLQQPSNAAGVTGVTGGRLCTGQYTYIWNIYSRVISNVAHNPPNKYDGSPDKPLHLVKLNDPGAEFCSDEGADNLIPTTGATELLSDNDLGVQAFKMEQLSQKNATGSALYSVSLTLNNAEEGAISGEVDTLGQCKPPSEDASYQDYCAVNQLDFIVRTGNEGGKG